MNPEDNSIDLTAGWNIIGYLRLEPASVDEVFEELLVSNNLLLVKNYLGLVYMPEYSYNGIGDILPGQGYQVNTVEEGVLQYLSNDESYRMSKLEVQENNVSHFLSVSNTDQNMIVVIEDAAWDIVPTEGSEVAAYDKVGTLVGSAIYTSPVTILTVWGDDGMTSSKEGLVVSEAVSFKVWDTETTSHFSVAKWVEGSSSYQVDAINIASSIVTHDEENTLIVSKRVLVKVVNVLGQEVNTEDQNFKGEVLFEIYNDGTVEKIVN